MAGGGAGNNLVRRAAGFMKLGRAKPVWYDTVADRFPPLSFPAPTAKPGHRPKNSPAPICHPSKIEYPEDRTIGRYLKEHKIENLRPVSVCDEMRDPENVDLIVQHQLELMEQGMSARKAYETAKQKHEDNLKKLRIQQRVAQEQLVYGKRQSDVVSGKTQMAVGAQYQPVAEVIKSFAEREKKHLSQFREVQLRALKERQEAGLPITRKY